MRRACAVLLAAVALALALAACGEKTEPARGTGKLEPFTVVLDYFPNADHAGLYAAQAAGDYARAGLDVRIQAPPDPSAPLKLLQAGRADLAISYEPELLLARDKGAELVSVGALVQRPLTSVMAVAGSGVRQVSDLAGKRVGTAGIPYQSAYLKTILSGAGVNPASVKETNVGFKLVPSMLSGGVDATLGAFWNYEGTDLQRRHKRPTILRMERLGVPTYAELVLTARRKDLDEEGASRIRRFLRATARGHERLRERPQTGIDALLKADRGLDRGLQEAAVAATLPVFFPADRSKPFGYQDPAEWDAYGRWMLENKLLTRPPDARRALTNEFLPGQGLDPAPAGRGG
ncbi:MAG: ABC transporter substrate-binding protein [Actinomycetota bacterium]|nr:ABC transporter substrate-binding protein [Actinomycetota bacterium]